MLSYKPVLKELIHPTLQNIVVYNPFVAIWSAANNEIVVIQISVLIKVLIMISRHIYF